MEFLKFNCCYCWFVHRYDNSLRGWYFYNNLYGGHRLLHYCCCYRGISAYAYFRHIHFMCRCHCDIILFSRRRIVEFFHNLCSYCGLLRYCYRIRCRNEYDNLYHIFGMFPHGSGNSLSVACSNNGLSFDLCWWNYHLVDNDTWWHLEQ